MAGISPQPRVNFGAFEVDSSAGELRKSGIRIKLHEKPFQILLSLLEHPGEVVTRKELQERLWPQDTFVEFENGLNNAIGRLREALGDTADTPHFIETIPRRGYRFIADTLPKTSELQNKTSRGWLIAAGIAIVIAAAVGLFLRLDRAQAQPIKSLAVLPFRNLGTGSQDDYFAAGMTDAVTTELARLGVSKVTSETSVEKFENTKEPVPQIVHALGVDAVVEGAVLQEGDRVRITVQLIRGDTDKHVWAQSYERQMTNILALQDEVALGVAQAIGLKLRPGSDGGLNTSPINVNPDAYKAYLKGRYYLQEGKEDPLTYGKNYFQQAIQLDQGYAPAYAGLADCYVNSDTSTARDAIPEAKKNAVKALQLDPNLPDGHAALAEIYFIFDWNWAAAELEFKKAIALAPNLVQTRLWYAKFLAAMGRATESMDQAQRAEELDPLSIPAHEAGAVASFSLGEYDRVLEEGGRIIQLDPNDPRGCLALAMGYLQKRMYPEAFQQTQKCMELTNRDPYFLSLAALIRGRLGEAQEAEKLLGEMREKNRKQYVAPVLFATALIGVGQREQAMDALEQAYKLHDGNMIELNAAPWFNALRSEPRFQDLLRKMNFPQLSH